ncbi:MAG: NAD(+) synthase [Parcubacteria group bacterium]|nr:NAD(+) synthase [Parcubacteria group bacterium]
MRLIKIGIANINPTVGALTSNTGKVIARAKEFSNAHTTLGIFSEQIIGGYPAEDLVHWQSFVEGQWSSLLSFAKETSTFPFPTVFIIGIIISWNGQVYNAGAVVCNGKIYGVVPKEKLPTYGVFYENRTLSRGIPGFVSSIHGVPFGDLIFEAPFGVFAVETCEDIWSPDGPMRRRAYSGAELIVNISASPFRIGVLGTRREMIATRAADNQSTLVYVNQVGGNDALVFDGGGFINQNGQMITELPRWREGITTHVIDLDRTARMRSENTTWRTDCEEYLKKEKPTERVCLSEGGAVNHPTYVYPTPTTKSFFLPIATVVDTRREFWNDIIEAMLAGLDYYTKIHVFKKIGIALSGGKDSALTLIIAWLFAKRLIGEDIDRLYNFINCFSMPTRFNSATTKTIARELAEELGVSFKEIPIEEAFEKEQGIAASMLSSGESLSPLTVQNIQARIRAQRMWNWANASHGLWLQTGNMSEKAVGYTTIGGDLSGGYSLIGNLPKTIIIELLKYLEQEYKLQSLKKLLETKASAELALNQEDEKDLMPFPVLDACFALFAGEKYAPKEIYMILRGMWSDEELKALAPEYTPPMLKDWVKRFIQLFSSSIFKWVQAPQTVHLGGLDLDRERALQLPVVESREWLERSLKEIDECP